MTEAILFIGFSILIALFFTNRKRFSNASKQNNISTKRTNDEKETLQVEIISQVKKDYSIYTSNFNAWKEETTNILNDSQSLSDLLIVKKLNEIYYGDLLNCFEWKFKRLKILLRDRHECRDCHKRDKFNHVHHLHYIQDELPWEIEDSGLITLCYDCHKKRHELNEITVFKRVNNDLIPVSKEKPYCIRCGGTGYIPMYKHVQNGICFKCWGNLIHQSVFNKIINETYQKINSYHDHLKREKYTFYTNQLSLNDFVIKVPDYESYVKHKTSVNKPFDDFDEIGDDLPF